MMWYKYLGVILLPVIVSFFYFPIVFRILPGVNTKMALAVIGCIFAGYQMARRTFPTVDKQLFIISLWALSISFITFFSMTYNDTSDDTYLTYIISMYVWLIGAYAVSTFIRWVHGKYTLTLISNYIIIVCVAQCVLALVIDQYLPAKNFVNHLIDKGDWIDSVHRLYGIGAELDTAGIRFSISLVMLGYLLKNAARNGLVKFIPFYLAGFIILAIVGNMVARTTSVGVLLFLFYLLLYRPTENPIFKKTLGWMILLAAVAVLIMIYFYNTNLAIYKYTRFAFEGFFNLYENGEWSIASNEKLKTMYVFPESMKTWLLGDGYIVNPKSDPYYTGKMFTGYYQNTDVGYLRFIFYFGIIGLLLFSGFILQVGKNCIKKIPQYKELFLLLLAVNFIVWFKVSTDIFLIFALLLFLDEEKEMNNYPIANENTL